MNLDLKVSGVSLLNLDTFFLEQTNGKKRTLNRLKFKLNFNERLDTVVILINVEQDHRLKRS